MRKTIFTLALVISLVQVNAQKMLTVSEAVLKQRTTLAPEKLSQLAWMGSTNSYAWVDNKDNTPALFSAEAKINQAKQLITLAEFNALLKGKGWKE